MAGIIPLMYQSGYLTIRDFDRQFGLYTLGFPNKEVERGFLNFLFPYYTSIRNGNGTFAIREFTRDISNGNVDSFMHRLQVYSPISLRPDTRDGTSFPQCPLSRVHALGILYTYRIP